jgi:hypothetical protein
VAVGPEPVDVHVPRPPVDLDGHHRRREGDVDQEATERVP